MGDESSSQGETPHGAPLSQWLQLMLAEIARKREEQERARDEAARRASESDPPAPRDEPDGIENPPLP